MTDDEIRKLVKDEIRNAIAVHKYEEHKRRSSAGCVRCTREELVAYCTEHRICLGVDKFIEYYESNGWMVGKNPMKSWKAAAQKAAREWCRDVNAPWLRTVKEVSREVPVNVISYAERVALKEKMQGVGRPVERTKPVVATRAMLNRLNEPIGRTSGPSPEFDLSMDPGDDDN